MSQFFVVHPEDPQARLLRRAADIVRDGGVIVYPTDSAYALGCAPGNRQAVERIRRIRRLSPGHNLTLVCRDFSELATYARVDNSAFRLIRAMAPGPYTFLLPATRLVPRMMQHPKRRTVGLRVPEHRVVQGLLQELDAPLLTTTLILPGATEPLFDPEDMRDRLEHDVDLVIDGGACGLEVTTVVDLVADPPVITRLGKGDPGPLEVVEAG